MTRVLQADLIAGAIDGGVISFPTDTVPALAVLPEKSTLIFQLKNRPANKPLILMAATLEDLLPYVQGNSQEINTWRQVAAKHLPGAVTLVLPASDRLPKALDPTASKTVGIRIPDLEIAREILAQTGALATTSANRSGEPPLEMMSDIAEAFPEILVLDCDRWESQGKIGSGLPSTVARWQGDNWQILRQGSILKL